MNFFDELKRRNVFKVSAAFASQVRGVRDQPAFRQAVADLELVGYWQLYGWPEVCRPVGAHDFECD